MNKDLLHLVNDWYFVKQPIYEITTNKIVFYELLLRSKTTKNFPAKKFSHLMINENGKKIFFDWLVIELENIFSKHTKIIVSINIDPIQINSENFISFLKCMKKYKSQLVIELTERIPNDMALDDLFLNLKAIKEEKFNVFLDDVDILNTTNNNWHTLLKYVDGVKLSPLSIKNNNKHKIKLLINKIRTLGCTKIISEGVSDENLLHQWLSYGITYQQGWYLGKEQIV